MDENKIPHGLLATNLKQSLIEIINQNPLDIQTKTMIYENVYFQLQRLSEEQTKRELEELRTQQNKNNEDLEVSE